MFPKRYQWVTLSNQNAKFITKNDMLEIRLNLTWLRNYDPYDSPSVFQSVTNILFIMDHLSGMQQRELKFHSVTLNINAQNYAVELLELLLNM